MSVAAVSSISVPQPIEPPVSRRTAEDQAGRQVEEALQAGDLSSAQSAYQQLASFGPNNSGPFTNPVLAQEFQAVGQAIQAGNLASAQTDANTLGRGVLTQDAHIASQDFQSGGWPAAQQAVANLAGDYWAVTGNSLPSGIVPPAENGGGGNTANPDAVNLQA